VIDVGLAADAKLAVVRLGPEQVGAIDLSDLLVRQIAVEQSAKVADQEGLPINDLRICGRR
jgi:hypothetical protein